MDQSTNNQPSAEPTQPVTPPPAPQPTNAPMPPVVEPSEQPTEAAPVTLEQHLQPTQAPAVVTSDAVDAEMVDDGLASEPSFVWQASEFVHHEKGGSWYVILGLIVIALLVVAYFTHQWLSIGVFLVAAAAVVVYARKAPRTLTYELSKDAISIDGRAFPFNQFRSFAVLKDLAWHTIDLEPTQRFMPRISVLFEDESYDAIVAHLSEHLPRVDRQPDAIERLTRYLRF